MNASKFKRMLKQVSGIERHLVTSLDTLRGLKLALENEQAAGQAIGIASAAPAKAKRVKEQRVKTQRPAKVKVDKTERSSDRAAKVKARNANHATLVVNATAKSAKQKKVKLAAPTEIMARHKKQKASRHEKIAPAQVKRNPKQRSK